MVQQMGSVMLVCQDGATRMGSAIPARSACSMSARPGATGSDGRIPGMGYGGFGPDTQDGADRVMR